MAMGAVVGRVVLGILAALAVVGGGMLVVMVVVYFAASEYLWMLREFGGWGNLAGMLALAVYVAGAFHAPLLMRIGAGLGLAGAGYFATTLVAYLVSLTADRGGPRGNLEAGAAGFIWLLAGAFFAWCLASRRWPVAQQELSTQQR
jgi:hypothetical protein